MTMTMRRRRPSCSRELLRGRRGQSVPTYPLLWETSDKAREKMILRHFLNYIATNIIWYRAQFSIGWKTQSVGSKERGNKRKKVHFWHKGGLPITILSVKCKSPVERPNLLAIQSSMIASQQRGILKQFSPASVLNFFSEIIDCLIHNGMILVKKIQIFLIIVRIESSFRWTNRVVDKKTTML